MPKDVILTPRDSRSSSRSSTPLHREAPRGRRADQGGARVRRHRRELRVRRRQERAGDARGADRAVVPEKLRMATVIEADGALHRRRRGRLGRPRQGREDRQVASLHDRRLGRGQARREQALQRVARRPRAARPPAQRDGRRCRSRAARRASSRSPRSTSASSSLPGMGARRRARDGSWSGVGVAGGGSVPEGAEEPTAGQRHGLQELLAARRAKELRLRELGAEEASRTPSRASEPIAPVLRRARGPRGRRGDRGRPPRRRAPRGRRDGGKRRLPRPRRPLRPHPAARPRRRARRGGLRAARLLDLGDLVGVDGAAIRTRRGELVAARRPPSRCSPSRCGRRRTSTTG